MERLLHPLSQSTHIDPIDSPHQPVRIDPKLTQLTQVAPARPKPKAKRPNKAPLAPPSRGASKQGHSGKWQDGAACRSSFPTEMYVGYGTNEYNFEKLPNPPAYEPTRCDGCGVVIKLSEDGYSQGPKGILYEKCTRKSFPASSLD
jgi:hypothetical protein